MFSREENTWSLSTAGVRAADCRTQVLRRGRGHSQLPTLHRPWGKEEWWSLKHWRATAARGDTCTWDRNWGSSQHRLPARAGDSPRLGAPTALSPLPCRGCTEPQRCLTRCDRPCSQHSHSQQGTAATPTLLHCLLLARSSKSGQLHAPSSAFQEKAFFSYNYEHLSANSSLFEESLTERQHPSTKAHSYSQLPSSGAPNWLEKAEVQALPKMRGKKYTLVSQEGTDRPRGTNENRRESPLKAQHQPCN